MGVIGVMARGRRVACLLVASLATALALAVPIAPALAQDSSGDAAAGAAAGLFGLGITGIWCCIAGIGTSIWLAGLVLWVWMIIDCAQRRPDEFPDAGENTKTIWLVILIVSWFVFGLYWLAALIYYFMVKRAMPRSV